MESMLLIGILMRSSLPCLTTMPASVTVTWPGTPRPYGIIMTMSGTRTIRIIAAVVNAGSEYAIKMKIGVIMTIGMIVATAINDLSYGGRSSKRKCSLSLNALHKIVDLNLVLYSVSI